jgi:hypothetical protein
VAAPALEAAAPGQVPEAELGPEPAAPGLAAAPALEVEVAAPGQVPAAVLGPEQAAPDLVAAPELVEAPALEQPAAGQELARRDRLVEEHRPEPGPIPPAAPPRASKAETQAERRAARARASAHRRSRQPAGHARHSARSVRPCPVLRNRS